MKITIIPKKNLKILVSLFIILFIGNIFSIYLKLHFHFSNNKTLVRLFNFDLEQNIPTLFSTSILLFSGFLLLYIGKSHQKRNELFKPWLFLGYIFIFLAIDEAISIHEIFGHILTTKFHLKGHLYFSWVIPYGFISILLLIYLFKFLKTLPIKTLRLFIFSGFIFFLGAVGIEIIGSKIAYDLRGIRNFSLTYNILYTIEESFEMIGVIIFINTLLKYIVSNNFNPLKIIISK